MKVLLDALPHGRPFRFVDDILAIDDNRIVGRYRYRPDEPFYAGHFPGDPITPGVILLETIAQIGLGVFAAYLLGAGAEPLRPLPRMLLTECSGEFLGVVRPGETVTVEAKKVYFRRLKLKVAATMRDGRGKLVCSAELAAMGALR